MSRRPQLSTCLLAAVVAAQTWTPQESGTTSSLRGLCAVDRNIVWASGTNGTYLTTVDGGMHWRVRKVPGAEALDFRDVQAFDDRTALLLSIGPGERSRVYATSDGGQHWTLQLTNPDHDGFFDEFAFWDRRHGILVGDQVGGRLVVMTTDDGGKKWQRRKMPAALAGEGVFAASGSGIFALGEGEVWIGTGGPGAARVFHSHDRGRTWSVAATGMRNDSPSAGIFSIAFSDRMHGIAVGGDYKRPEDSAGNIAVTSDGGRTWVKSAGQPPGGFRSAVVFLPDRKIWIATGTSGSDVSFDGGQSWRTFDRGNYNAIGSRASTAAWAAGPDGRIARFMMQ